MSRNKNTSFSGRSEDSVDTGRVEKLPKPVHPAEETAQPVETARRPEMSYEEMAASRKRNNGNIWKFIAVLAVIVVVVVIAIVLVIKMNQPAEPVQESEKIETVHVLNTDGEEVETKTNTVEPEEKEPEVEGEEAPAVPEEEESESEPVGTEPEEEPEIEVEPADDTVYVTGSGVNLRSGPSTTYGVLASVSGGTELQRTGTVNGWSRVEYGGNECYVSNSLISTEKPAAAAETSYSVSEAGGTVTVASDANIRKGPGTDSEVIGVAKAGTDLTRTGISGGWTRISYNGGTAFVATSLVRDASTGEEGTVTVVSKANVRSGAGTGYDILGVAEVGDTLDMKSHTASNWYEVDYNGQTGYIAGNLVKEN